MWNHLASQAQVVPGYHLPSWCSPFETMRVASVIASRTMVGGDTAGVTQQRRPHGV